LQEFISTIPEHKGNEKMRGYLRKRLAQLKMEMEEQRKRKVGGGWGGFSIKKEGAAQIVMLGLTGSGKSSLLTRVTNAKAEVSGHPFTTRAIPGMMQYEDIQFQLVDMPAIYEGIREGALGTQVFSLARNSDGLLLVLSGEDPVNQFMVILKELSEAGIIIERKEERVEIEVRNGGGIQLMCLGRIDCEVEEINRLLKARGVRNAIVKVWGEVKLRDFEEALDQTKIYKPSLIVVNKLDLYPDALEDFKSKTGKEAIGLSVLTGKGIDDLGNALFKAMGIVRVYTRGPSGEVANKPIIVPIGTKVLDVAKIVHSHLYKNFKYAKVWGSSINYNGERVGGDHVLADRDIVEIRIR
ncbi:MAG: GTPase, partial [Candidatus Methanomethylicaceae archaeon]